METMQSLDKDISKRKRYLMTIISCLAYVILAAVLGILSKEGGFGRPHPLLTDLTVLRGVITQIQMMISVYLVLALNREGLVTAVLLNVVSLTSAILFILRENSSASVPGMTSYIAVIIILILMQLSEMRLYHQVNRDSLTKLQNRDFYLQNLDREVENAQRSGSILGIVFIDLDSFKSVNDSLGHSAGDEVLVEVSRRFSEIPDPNYVVARSGGDEFFVLIRDVADLTDIERIINKIMKTFMEPFFVQGTELSLTASVGIAVYPADGDRSPELIKNADMAMYEAKRKGKNQYLFCSESMKRESIKKMILTKNLYKALEREELFLHYQPQIQVETGAVIGFEALLRWNHPDYGMIPPGTFIPLAEQTGLIKPIGLWAFRAACEECLNCSSEYKDHIRISINFSVEQLKDVYIVEQLTGIIRETGIDPQKIQIEITESVAFSRDTAILEKLMQLKKLGLLIAIDDFGKEYSAFNRIRSIPVDLLKIDMDFIYRISSGNPKDRAIVKTIIQLAKNLGVTVLAEGVETEEQYEFLKSEKCDEIQGFYFYKGMLAAEAQALLRNCHSDIE